MPVIEMNRLSKFFGKTPAVREATLAVEEGDFFGFVGPNGSGKTTTIRMLMNFLRPTSGKASIFGMDTVKKSVDIKKRVGYVPSEIDYCENMKAHAVIHFACSLRGYRESGRIDELCDLFEVDVDRTMGKMSLGNRKKVALVAALAHSPRLLILDEATTGLDPLIKKRFLDVLRHENKKGVTVFMCSHDMAEVQQLCQKIAIIRQGSILEVTDTTILAADEYRRISVKSPDDLTAAYEFLKIEQVTSAGGYESFRYRGELDLLIKILANYHVEDLKIDLPSLEDAIVRFYEKKLEEEDNAHE